MVQSLKSLGGSRFQAIEWLESLVGKALGEHHFLLFETVAHLVDHLLRRKRLCRTGANFIRPLLGEFDPGLINFSQRLGVCLMVLHRAARLFQLVPAQRRRIRHFA